ncbi:fatty acyl-ACP thioesterases B [Hibiscus trionum]|uniref:Acyl-[acyl-carrier-protein] hydrolase n=1 Tax=Hibiscus trionum TaxID=183268 RepID=A0A9W7ICR3_HIBTR|nr:fatty acyl-ACP thioesterases B [Hibiscus trionum]
MKTMLAYRAEPTVVTVLSSSLAWDKPKLRSGGNIKNLHNHIGVKYPKCTKSITSSYNMGGRTRKPDPDKIHDILGGRMVEENRVFQQELMVRSSDIGSDRKLSIVALSNYLQDTLVNHGELIGVLSDGFSTPEMSRRDLVWVAYKTGIAIHCYPSRHDVIQVHTKLYESGKNRLGVDWIFSDLNSGNPLILASSLYTMMNMRKRKLSKFVEEARMELKPYFMPENSPLIENTRKIQTINIDTTDFTSLDLCPGWNDLDINQHVNNAKYIEWILEGVPSSIKKSHGISRIDMEFRKECDSDATLQCLSKMVGNYNSESHSSANGNNEGLIEVEHSLRLDSGQEIARGRTSWNPKHHQQLG